MHAAGLGLVAGRVNQGLEGRLAATSSVVVGDGLAADKMPLCTHCVWAMAAASWMKSSRALLKRLAICLVELLTSGNAVEPLATLGPNSFGHVTSTSSTFVALKCNRRWAHVFCTGDQTMEETAVALHRHDPKLRVDFQALEDGRDMLWDGAPFALA